MEEPAPGIVCSRSSSQNTASCSPEAQDFPGESSGMCADAPLSHTCVDIAVDDSHYSVEGDEQQAVEGTDISQEESKPCLESCSESRTDESCAEIGGT